MFSNIIADCLILEDNQRYQIRGPFYFTFSNAVRLIISHGQIDCVHLRIFFLLAVVYGFSEINVDDDML